MVKYKLKVGGNMGNLENTLMMLLKLKKGNIVKKSELAKELGVSEKQISRYKKALDELFTIESIPGPTGGYKLIDSYFPFKELLTEDELLLLQYYAKSIQYIDNSKLARALDKINYSILNGNNQSTAEIIPFSRIKNSNLNEMQAKAYESILYKYEIIIEYKSNQGLCTKRRIHPYKLFIYKGEYYILAKCLMKDKIRYFKLVRIKDMIVTSTKFDDDFDADTYLKKVQNNSLGIFNEKEYKLKMIVHPPMANTVSERIWVDNQIITELDDGSILFEATMKGGPEIISWIFSLRIYAEVIEPDFLKRELQEELEKMIKNFKK